MSALPENVLLEDVPCPLGCVRSDRTVVEAGDLLHGVPGRFRVVECRCCGLMRTNPRPTSETIGTYYPAAYAPYAPPPVQSAKPVAAWRRWLRAVAGDNTRRTPPLKAGRLLEIGCAHGSYLAQMRAAGWEVEGIEFSEAAAAKARARGLRVRTGTVESVAPPDEPVDLVAAWMVLEHLHEPATALRRMAQWVRPGGYLIASVPDASAFERRLFGSRWYALQLPTHLYHYSPRTLQKVLDHAGWDLRRVSWQRNSNNLLWSLQYWGEHTGRQRIARLAIWLRTSRRGAPLRFVLSWLLGVTRQSGRMEIWAQARPKGQGGQ